MALLWLAAWPKLIDVYLQFVFEIFCNVFTTQLGQYYKMTMYKVCNIDFES